MKENYGRTILRRPSWQAVYAMQAVGISERALKRFTIKQIVERAPKQWLAAVCLKLSDRLENGNGRT